MTLSARATVAGLRSSKIRQVANVGMGRKDVLPFWFGESDETTPEFIRQAGMAALEEGDTFYTQNLGIPPLREAIASYLSRLHRPTQPDQIVVTNSGMSALMLVTQALVGPADRVVIVTPVWPNLVEIPRIMGGESVTVPLDFTASGWALNLERLLSALTPSTRLLIINSPGNPTGWTIDRASQAVILEHCRKHGIWILSDDAYERLYFAEAGQGPTPAAPSFFDLAGPDDRVVSANTFSKSWLMTGWRLGWICAPAALVNDLGTLVEYNTSCAPGFVQRAGLVAITQGDHVIERSLARLRASRDFLIPRLAALDGVEVASPQGAMYAFFRVSGIADSLEFCKRLVVEASVGLAPGSAFGDEGEGFIRWCFATDITRLETGLERFASVLAAMRR
jgi:aspartate/methionine/tyrosine aminotransferase